LKVGTKNPLVGEDVGTSSTLLIGMLASANAMESSIAVPQKPKNRTTI
jgi:hypothetical protein